MKSAQLPDDDPRVRECRAALAYWRCRRLIDRDEEDITPQVAADLIDRLRGLSEAATGAGAGVVATGPAGTRTGVVR